MQAVRPATEGEEEQAQEQEQAVREEAAEVKREVAKAHEVVVPVQINGKVRARLNVPAGLSDDELRERALGDAVVKTHTEGKTIRKVVVAKGPLVSVVVG